MSDNTCASATVQASVAAELDWDPKIDSSDIVVTADRGAVAMRGTVGNLRQLREALCAARRVHGVTSVSNGLTVRSVASGRAEDREVRIAVLHAGRLIGIARREDASRHAIGRAMAGLDFGTVAG